MKEFGPFQSLNDDLTELSAREFRMRKRRLRARCDPYRLPLSDAAWAENGQWIA